MMYYSRPMLNKTLPLVLTCILVLSSVSLGSKTDVKRASIPPATLLLITKAEDERRWDDELRNLFSNPSAAIRKRAALAAGRIGNEDSISCAHEPA